MVERGLVAAEDDAFGGQRPAGGDGAFLGQGAAGGQVQQHLEPGLTQLAGGGLDAVVQGQATDDYRVHLLHLEVFDGAGGAALGQVVVAGAIRVQVGFDAFPHVLWNAPKAAISCQRRLSIPFTPEAPDTTGHQPFNAFNGNTSAISTSRRKQSNIALGASQNHTPGRCHDLENSIQCITGNPPPPAHRATSFAADLATINAQEAEIHSHPTCKRTTAPG